MKSRRNELIQSGSSYLERGWRPIPIQANGKRPLVQWRRYQEEAPSEHDLGNWFHKWPDANIGILTGQCSGLVAIDVDGPSGMSELAPHLGVVKTLTSTTSRGRHLLFQHPGLHVPTRAGILPDVDVRGDGGYIVAPPSVHESGHLYTWEEGNPHIPIAPLPESLIQVVRSGSLRDEKVTAVVDGSPIPIGTRNDTLTRVAGSRLGLGHSEEEVLAHCMDINATRCCPPLAHDEVVRTVASIAKRERGRARSKMRKAPAKDTPETRFTAVPLNAIQPRTTEWLWNGYIPRGKVVILDGDPGLGKSTLTLDIAARIAEGREMPDGSRGVYGQVVIMTSEDGLDDTVRPRLDAIGASLENIKAITAVGGQFPRIPEDLAAITEELIDSKAVLLIIDPLMAFLSGRVDSWKDQDIRRALSPLTAMAHETGTTILGVRHLNKVSGGQALYRGGGSIGLIGAARAGFLIAPHPELAGKLVLASTKSNLAKRPRSLTFTLNDCQGVPTLKWEGACAYTADDLVARTPEDSSGTLEPAMSFLKEELKDGKKLVAEVMQKARLKGYSERTMERARTRLGVESLGKLGGGGGHWICLPRTKGDERESA